MISVVVQELGCDTAQCSCCSYGRFVARRRADVWIERTNPSFHTLCLSKTFNVASNLILELSVVYALDIPDNAEIIPFTK